MGCAVGTADASRLRDCQQQVEELKKKLDERELENGELRRRLEALRSAGDAVDSPRPLARSESSSEKTTPQQRSALGSSLDGVPEAWAGGNENKCHATSSGNLVAIQGHGRPTSSFTHSRPPSSDDQQSAVGHDLLNVEADSSNCNACSPSHKTKVALCDDHILPGSVVEALPSACMQTLPGLGGWDANPSTGSDTPLRETLGEAEDSFAAQLQSHIDDEVTGKLLLNCMDSDASTATPAAASQGTLPAGPCSCHQCGHRSPELFLDPSDLNRYCESCWIEYYNQPPGRGQVAPLVPVEVVAFWVEEHLSQAWAMQRLPGWPPSQSPVPLVPEGAGESEVWSTLNVRIRRGVVGPHAREQFQGDSPQPNEVLVGRYRAEYCIGEGHFTKAFLAEDLQEGRHVCLKRHRSLSVEALADLLVIGRRLDEVDPEGHHFPRLIDSFYDVVCFTVESLVQGQNCLAVAQSSPGFFTDLTNLRCVARGGLLGLSLLDTAGVVHNDVKPDNLIWVEEPGPASCGISPAGPGCRHSVRIVDFGCARLDQRLEPGRNWSLAEGGAGHLGKWSPEMALRLPITHRGDVWGMAISLCELYCGRCVWRNEADTAEVVLAQAVGLCNLREGLPASLLCRSPLDVPQLYSPAPCHMPLRRNAQGHLEVLQPARWGLEQVLGEGWREAAGVAQLGELLETALVVDPALRPSAAELLEGCSFSRAEAALGPGRWLPTEEQEMNSKTLE